MVKLFNLARVVTSIFLILVLLFVYANLPDRVGLFYSASGQMEFYLNKNDFFYSSLILSLAINLIVIVFVKVFQSLPVKPDRVFFTNAWFKEKLIAWLAALSPVMNLFFIFIVSFVGIYNSGDAELINSYGYLAYLGQFLVLGWLVALIFIVLNKSQN